MFGFGKRKSKNAIKTDDDGDFYRPQPVNMQRSWATKPNASSKKRSPPKYQQRHQKQPSGSNGSHHHNPLISASDADPEFIPPPPAGPPPPQYQQQSMHSQPMTSGSMLAMDSQKQFDSLSLSLCPYLCTLKQALCTLHIHIFCTLSVYARCTVVGNAISSKPDDHGQRRVSEGVAKTGMPEVVGDISTWRAQQHREQQMKANPNASAMAAYPVLNGDQNDGGPVTGGLTPFPHFDNMITCIL